MIGSDEEFKEAEMCGRFLPEGSSRTLTNESCKSGADFNDKTVLKRFEVPMRQVKHQIEATMDNNTTNIGSVA